MKQDAYFANSSKERHVSYKAGSNVTFHKSYIPILIIHLVGIQINLRNKSHMAVTFMDAILQKCASNTWFISVYLHLLIMFWRYVGESCKDHGWNLPPPLMRPYLGGQISMPYDQTKIESF